MIDLVVGDSKFSIEIAKKLGKPHVNIETTIYQDGEVKPTIIVNSEKEIKNKNVLLCLSRSRFKPDTNDYTIRLYFVLNSLRELNSKTITIIIPYMNYTRQTKNHFIGEPLSLNYFLKLFDNVSIITVNSHLFGKDDFYKHSESKIFDIDCTKVFAAYHKGKIKNPVIIGPDKGSLNMVKILANNLGCNYYCLEKTRDKKTSEIKISKPTDMMVGGKDVIIYDDLTATGNTIKATYDIIEKLNPKTISIGIVHLWGEQSIEKLLSLPKVKSIITTNSFVNDKNLNSKVTELSIVDVILQNTNLR